MEDVASGHQDAEGVEVLNSDAVGQFAFAVPFNRGEAEKKMYSKYSTSFSVSFDFGEKW